SWSAWTGSAMVRGRPSAITARPAAASSSGSLPAFDNAILGYRDRSRIIDDADLGLSVAGLRAVLVDGRVAATWTTRDRRLGITPLRPLSPQERGAVEEEAHALAAFLDQGIDDIGFTAP
ncbi:crosslink repair DNA glycosylase YcaQ family protein, partial [Streptomyces sp. ME02-6979-3A]|uniref:DNA glycosylase AlkZ-like family protein n=1 Tax=Streptomyces sp. ME02-6979-3A TaxID=3028673 RepID=UPI0029BA25C1